LKGQLGVGDKKSRYFPERIYKDILCNDLPKFKYISCGYYNTFAITREGKLYSWGSGNIGQKDE
jgi:alpha-tubulin suppressor-like RCC1 family protein